MHHKQRCHLKCICDALDEACSSLCNDTPASLMCYASRLVTIRSWARLSSCVVSGPSGIVPETEACVGGGGAKGGDGSGLIRCLFNFSNSRRCHSATGVCWGGLSSPRSGTITEQNGDGVISEVVSVGFVCIERSLLMQYFWLLERLSCIMHVKFRESVVVYQPSRRTSQPLCELPACETSCVCVGRGVGFLLTSSQRKNKLFWSFGLSWLQLARTFSQLGRSQK